MSAFLTRCGECDEWWCRSCETECPVCLVGAGIETGIVTCGGCGDRLCGECCSCFDCATCDDHQLCGECWFQTSICSRCRHRERGEEPEEEVVTVLDLPPGFSINPEPERDHSKADKKAWRPQWERSQRRKPWKGETE